MCASGVAAGGRWARARQWRCRSGQRALVARLRIGRPRQRATVQWADSGRRFHPRMSCPDHRHVAVRSSCRTRTRPNRSDAGPADDDRQRQRHRVDVSCDLAMAGRTRRALALYRPRQATAERIRRKPQRTVPRRMSQRAPSPQPRRGAADHRDLAEATTKTTIARTQACKSSRRRPLQHAAQSGIWRQNFA